jgi:hypothetical protein
MIEKYTKFNKIINDIEFKMIRNDDNCWIKVEPLIQHSAPASLHIILNDEDHHWDIYDNTERDTNKIYFKGYKCTPSFYLKSGDSCFRIDCNYDGFEFLPIEESHSMDGYLKDFCHCKSLKASCWAIAIYYTSRREKPPFCEM